MNFSSSIRARIARTVGAAGLSLVIMFGVLAANPHSTFAASSLVRGGTATVVTTGNGTLRVRSGAGTSYDQVAEAHQGESVTILDGPAKDSDGNTWYKISAPDGTGWVISDYLSGKAGSSNTAAPASPASASSSGATYTIVNTGGGTVRIRSGAGTSFDQVGEAHEGQAVTILSGSTKDSDGNKWYKISAPGGTGWIISDYLSDTKTTTAGTTAAPSKPTGLAAGSLAAISNTDGSTVRVRSGAGTSNDQVAEAHEGETVTVLAGPSKDSDGNKWYKVSAPGGTGWVIADYLTAKAGTGSNASTTSNDNTKPQAAPAKKAITPSGPKLTGFARVGNSDGDPVRLRTSASSSASVITMFDANTSVAVKSGPVMDSNGVTWYEVSGNSVTGWMMAQYLIQAEAPAVPAAPKVPAAPAAAKAPAATEPPATPTPAPATPAPTEVPVAPAAPAPEQPAAPAATKEPATPTQAPVPAAAPTADPARSGTARGSDQPAAAAAAPATNRGDNIVSFALKYVGARYVMGGVGPRVFDCSGFIYFVMNHSGVPMSRDMYSQWNSGAHVSRANLQPGDILFFSNTYKRGLSHEGLYIGNGKFVHAENESTGVRISSINESYYIVHYTGAVRPR